MLPLTVLSALLVAAGHAAPPRASGYMGHGVSHLLAEHRFRGLG